jgi:hypothetical protein
MIYLNMDPFIALPTSAAIKGKQEALGRLGEFQAAHGVIKIPLTTGQRSPEGCERL